MAVSVHLIFGIQSKVCFATHYLCHIRIMNYFLKFTNKPCTKLNPLIFCNI
jgi:hypothetical protein